MEISPPVFCYDVLPIPKENIEKEFFISFYDNNVKESQRFKFIYIKGSTVQDIFNDLSKCIPTLDPNNLRLLKVDYSRIKKIYQSSDKLENIQNFSLLRAEEISEVLETENEKLIQCEHFWRDSSQFRTFDDPFLLKITKVIIFQFTKSGTNSNRHQIRNFKKNISQFFGEI
jgi:hypothetical protein